MKFPIVSICIPTFKRPEIVKETIMSIFSQDVDEKLFNVCITDNSATDETKNMIEKEIPQFSNLFYKKVNCEGFMNSIETLKYGNGKLLKLHNDYSKFLPGSLQKMIDRIETLEEDSVIHFAMGNKEFTESFSTCTSFDFFMNTIHYWSTWSSSFAVWKKDFDLVMSKNIILDKMFPHTSILFDLVNKPIYYIDNESYVENLPLKKKGGYNLPDNFVHLYLDMVNMLYNDKNISELTFRKIKENILKFVAEWYLKVNVYKNIYSFSFDNWEQCIEKYYGREGVFYIKEMYRKNIVKMRIKNVQKKFLETEIVNGIRSMLFRILQKLGCL